MTSDQDVEQLCRSRLAAMLDLDESAILPDTTFASLGLDSAAAVHFVLDIEQEMGIELYPGVTGDHPTVAQFAEYVGGRVK